MLVPWPYFVNQSFKLRNLTVALLILFAQNAGCVRFLWNELNALNTKEYKAYQDYLKAVEAVKYDPMFSQLRNSITSLKWLKHHVCAILTIPLAH